MEWSYQVESKIESAMHYMDDFEKSDVPEILNRIEKILKKKVDRRHEVEKEEQIRDINKRNYLTAQEKWRKDADYEKCMKVYKEYRSLDSHQDKHKHEWARRKLKFVLADTVNELWRKSKDMEEAGIAKHGYREISIQ